MRTITYFPTLPPAVISRCGADYCNGRSTGGHATQPPSSIWPSMALIGFCLAPRWPSRPRTVARGFSRCVGHVFVVMAAMIGEEDDCANFSGPDALPNAVLDGARRGPAGHVCGGWIYLRYVRFGRDAAESNGHRARGRGSGRSQELRQEWRTHHRCPNARRQFLLNPRGPMTSTQRTPKEDLLLGGLEEWADAGWALQSGPCAPEPRVSADAFGHSVRSTSENDSVSEMCHLAILPHKVREYSDSRQFSSRRVPVTVGWEWRLMHSWEWRFGRPVYATPEWDSFTASWPRQR